MRFCDELKIKKGITALIGSGGKTSLMLRLAQELSENGSVIVCTTTHIAPPDLPIVCSENERELSQALQKNRIVCAASAQEDGKLRAPKLPMQTLRALSDFVLVEADGAKRLPLKAHAAWEPVVPENANQVICVAGLSGIGKPIAQVVHRAEIFCKNLGLDLQEEATAQAVARHLNLEALHTAVFLNQLDSANAEIHAEQMAKILKTPVFAGSIRKGSIQCLR